jgi:hypothetical protein
MPQQTLPSGQDWETQNAGRGTAGKRMTVPTSGRELERAKAMGLVTTEKRYENYASHLSFFTHITGWNSTVLVE